MKLKFIPVALMLLLGFNACDTYEESDSVANMRNARAEYFKSEAAINLAKATVEEANAAYRLAETAVKNFEASLKEAEVKSAQLANAKIEALNAMEIAEAQVESDNAMLELANDKVVLANALMALENAKIVLEGQKITAEYNFTVIANGLVIKKDDALNTAYGKYTTAYGAWNTSTNTLLDENSTLISAKFLLATIKYDFDNIDVQANKEADIADLKLTKAGHVASLELVNDLKETNDWDAFIVERDAMVAKKLVAVTIKTNMSDADVAATMIADAAADATVTAAGDAVTAAGEVVTAANADVTAAYLNITEWVVENPAAIASLEKGIYLTVKARQDGFDAAKLLTSNAKDAMDDKQDDLDAPGLTTYETELLEEELVALTKEYNDLKVISDAFVATFDADVAALNAAYDVATTGVETAKAAQTLATDAKIAADEAKVLTLAAATAATAATASETAAIGVMTTEIARLNALAFIYNTSTDETKSETLDNMAEKIDAAIKVLEDLIEGVDGDDQKIYAAEKLLAKIVAGDYDEAEAVRDQELVIAKQETKIAKLTLMVAEAKANLDARQAEYNALLED